MHYCLGNSSFLLLGEGFCTIAQHVIFWLLYKWIALNVPMSQSVYYIIHNRMQSIKTSLAFFFRIWGQRFHWFRHVVFVTIYIFKTYLIVMSNKDMGWFLGFWMTVFELLRTAMNKTERWSWRLNRLWKESVVDYFKILSWHSVWKLRKFMKASVSRASTSAEIWARYLLYINLKSYCSVRKLQ
jgi:hypothetical protein